MGIFSSKDEDGSLKSVTETIAFPYGEANKYYQPIELNKMFGIHFLKVEPNIGKQNGALIFCHGNCMTVDKYLAQLLQKMANYFGITIYAPEYPGYGAAQGNEKPTAESCTNVLQIMMKIVFGVYNHKNIYLMAHSIGTGVVINYATTRVHNLKGIILLSPYKSITSVVHEGSYLTSFDFFKSINNIHKVNTAVCIQHGKEDTVIGYKHSEALYKNLNKKNNGELHILDNVDHNNILSSIKCWDNILSFIKSI